MRVRCSQRCRVTGSAILGFLRNSCSVACDLAILRRVHQLLLVSLRLNSTIGVGVGRLQGCSVTGRAVFCFLLDGGFVVCDLAVLTVVNLLHTVEALRVVDAAGVRHFQLLVGFADRRFGTIGTAFQRGGAVVRRLRGILHRIDMVVLRLLAGVEIVLRYLLVDLRLQLLVFLVTDVALVRNGLFGLVNAGVQAVVAVFTLCRFAGHSLIGVRVRCSQRCRVTGSAILGFLRNSCSVACDLAILRRVHQLLLVSLRLNSTIGVGVGRLQGCSVTGRAVFCFLLDGGFVVCDLAVLTVVNLLHTVEALRVVDAAGVRHFQLLVGFADRRFGTIGTAFQRGGAVVRRLRGILHRIDMVVLRLLAGVEIVLRYLLVDLRLQLLVFLVTDVALVRNGLFGLVNAGVQAVVAVFTLCRFAGQRIVLPFLVGF